MPSEIPADRHPAPQSGSALPPAATCSAEAKDASPRVESSDWREDEFRKLVEAQVQIILDEQAHGAKNAIRLAALTEKVIARLGDLVGNRKVATVRRRVEEGVSALSEVGFCGSLSSVGVFIPETADEIDAVTGEQFRRGFKTLRRARGFKRATVDALLAFAGQLGLLDTKEKAA